MIIKLIILLLENKLEVVLLKIMDFKDNFIQVKLKNFVIKVSLKLTNKH